MIRPFTAIDMVPVENLLRDTGNFREAEIALAREIVESVLQEPEQHTYHAVVFDDDADEREVPVGFLVVGPTPATAGTWDLYWIAVTPARYGTGVAQALEQYAVNYVRQRGGYWLISETSGLPNYERPRSFYKKQGYQLLARIPDYYLPGDDLLIYGKRLGSDEY